MRIGWVNGVVRRLLDQLQITSGGVYTPPSGSITPEAVTGVTTLTGTTDRTLLVSATGAYALTLPTAAGRAGQRIVVLCDDSVTLTNVVTLTPDGAETIDGLTGYKLIAPRHKVTLVSTGTEWAIEGSPSSDTGTFTPTGSFDNTTYTGWYKVVGKAVVLHYNLTFSAQPSAASLTLNIPTGITPVETSGSVPALYVGNGIFMDGSATRGHLPCYYHETNNNIAVTYQNAAGTVTAVTQAAPVVIALDDDMHFSIWLSVTGN